MRRTLSVLALGALMAGASPSYAGLELREAYSGGGGNSGENPVDIIMDKTRTGNQGPTNYDYEDGWDDDGGYESRRIEPRDGYYPDAGVEIWSDRGENAAYCVGDDVRLSFRVDQDSYLTIYDLDTDGRVRVLFPNDWHTDNFVRGGRTYTLPRRGYRFEVVGPSGREYIRAVVSTHPDYQYRHGGRPRVWDREWDSRGRKVSRERFDGYFKDNVRPWSKGRKNRDDDDRRYAGANMDETMIYIEDSRRCGGSYDDRDYRDDRRQGGSTAPWRRPN